MGNADLHEIHNGDDIKKAQSKAEHSTYLPDGFSTASTGKNDAYKFGRFPVLSLAVSTGPIFSKAAGQKPQESRAKNQLFKLIQVGHGSNL